jgi:hypothetical protein
VSDRRRSVTLESVEGPQIDAAYGLRPSHEKQPDGPYLHNNSAATLEEVLDHYEASFAASSV